jgi:hypothetical protein
MFRRSMLGRGTCAPNRVRYSVLQSADWGGQSGISRPTGVNVQDRDVVFSESGCKCMLNHFLVIIKSYRVGAEGASNAQNVGKSRKGVSRHTPVIH